MKLFSLCAISLTTLLISACQSTAPAPKLPSTNQDGISATIAQQRANRVSEISYQLHLDVTNDRQLTGETQIQFRLGDNQQALRLDFKQAQISNLVINAQKLYPNYDGNRLLIPATLLRNGNNLISLHFRKAYSQGDQGLIQYRDPVDGQRYLYSHFVPSSAQTMMPQFDQPDLRASYQLSVLAPKEWQLASAATLQKSQAQGDNTLWQFSPSLPVSPHNFSLLAGPYQSWQQDNNGITLQLLAPQSVASQIEANTWLTQTAQAMSYYEQRLATPYPFGHYTQAIVPHLPSDFRANMGQTSFNQASLSAAVTGRLLRQALAEQWLGNLVTLKWWDQFWLNQSLAHLVADDAETQLIGKPLAINLTLDNYSRSAPQIARQVANSLELFDSNTVPNQNKAIAQLSQLKFMLGESHFYLGIAHYLKTFPLQNADLNDFLLSLETVTNQPLSQWGQEAFMRAGVTRLTTRFRCEAGRITEFDLHQLNGGAASNRVKLGLFTLGRNALHKNLVSEVTYQGEHTPVKHLIGVRCPDLVFSNYQNKAYVRVKLDDASLETALLHLSSIEEPELRLMLWQTLWESVLAGELPLNRFIGSALINLPVESAPQVLASAQDLLRQAKAMLEQMSPNQQRYSRQALNAIAQMSLRLTISNKAQPEVQSLWFDNYLHFAISHQAKRHLASLLDGKEQLSGITLTPARRWQMLIHLNRYDYPGAERLVQREKQADDSNLAQQAALSALVARPSAKEKRQWFERVQAHTQESDPQLLEKLTMVMRQLYHSEQKSLSQATAEQRLDELAQLDKRNSQVFMQRYTRYLLPRSCNYASVARLEALLAQPEGYSPTTVKGINQTIASEQECIRVLEAMQHLP